jgi:hypothetical protein
MTSSAPSPPPTSPPPATSSWEWRAREYLRTVDRNGWVPKRPPANGPHPRQRQFLLLADVPEILYGGAAGGGKSDAS